MGISEHEGSAHITYNTIFVGAVLIAVLLLGAGTAAAVPADERATALQSDAVVSDAPADGFHATSLQEDGQAEDNETQEDDAEQEEVEAGQADAEADGGPNEAVPISAGWHAMTFDDATERHTIQWETPLVTGPEPEAGQLFLRVLGDDGNRLLQFNATAEIEPGGREFVFESTETEGRLRGGITVYESETTGGNFLSIAFRGDDLVHEEYVLRLESPDGVLEEVRVEADDSGRLSTGIGPVPTDLPANESVLTISVEGPGFDETTHVSPPGEAAEEEPVEPFVVEAEDEDIVVTIFSPAIEEEDVGPVAVLHGEAVNTFELGVTDGDGNVEENVTVEWQLQVDGLAQQPFVDRDAELADLRRQLDETQRLLETALNRTAEDGSVTNVTDQGDQANVTDDAGGVDAANETVRTLTIESTGPQATYAFTVSGELAKSTAMDATVNEFDVVEDDSAAGVVSDAGRDSYEFTGDVTSFTADGEVTLYLDGEQITEDELIGNATNVTEAIDETGTTNVTGT